uniref:t-SNARE coiled-coil homology domain-containing protein n=1 Tax=Hyaloperonospora arabidopsidis (strain Emoy2) TaxID=559515 RepID=M4BME4_HYAAE
MSKAHDDGGGGIFAAGNGSGVIGGGPHSTKNNRNNYNTFLTTDQSIQSLMRTSDNIERTRRTVEESEEVAKNVLVDLELQHSQLHEMKGVVSETSGMTSQVRHLLQMIATRSKRKKVCLYMVIVALAITDILVFYLLFVR